MFSNGSIVSFGYERSPGPWRAPADSEAVMSVRAKLFAMTYDWQMSTAEEAGLRSMRQRLLADATGQVIEIGAGTGANLPCYGLKVESLAVTEPLPPMMRKLERRVRDCGSSAKVLRAPAEDLPFDNDTFDVAVSTLVLCGVDDQPRALRELRRVLRPGGRLLFLEHVRADDPAVARLQDRINWLNRIVICCNLNRPTLDTIKQVGFAVTSLEHTALPKAPKFVGPAIMGVATKLRVRPPGAGPTRLSHAPPVPVRRGVPRGGRSLFPSG